MKNFVINKNKTYFSGTKKNKRITGLVVTERSVGIGRVMLRSIKAKIHHLLVGRNDDLPHIIGLLSYIYGVDKKNYKHLIRYIQKLSLKYSGVPQELKDMVAKHNNLAASTLSEV
uniref:hypothetical protein n=1 Tax=Aeromonas hydrophila TaxID=644 RepID=UPI001FEECD3B|nr:hypothetical protein [Aeromonas hydrophila]